MRLGTRIFCCYLVIFAVCLYYPMDWMMQTLRSRYLEGVEDPLVDTANLLATMAGLQMEAETFDPEYWYAAFDRLDDQPLSAKIYRLTKHGVDIRIYITDADGRIRFHSGSRETIGADYSQWRDVYLTLKGRYGGRATLDDPADPTSSVLYVAAPITVDGAVEGVLTVAKPTTNIKYFLQNAKPRIVGIGALALGAAVLLSFVVSLLLTRPIGRLTRYAEDVRDGKRPDLPRLDGSEIGEMGAAFEEMREALEGKRYVERYVQTLTHEIKSPLSAIRGAAELMAEPMDDERRARFLTNIHTEARRIQEVVDRMLALSALENRKRLPKTEPVALSALAATVMESKAPGISQKGLVVETRVPPDLNVSGESFLLHQAVSNLVQNAVDFSPPGGRIILTAEIVESGVRISVTDGGPGVPDYAREKVFDKFFSLKRPDTGRKSTGLGLNFVREVATLHGGSVRLENRASEGTRAVLEVPLRR